MQVKFLKLGPYNTEKHYRIFW